ERRGESGFGYDPVFMYEDSDKTFAEVSMDEKSKVSHRGRAMQELAGEFDNVMTWIKQRMEEIKPPKADHTEFEHNDWSEEKMV
ncbi:MAG: Non-canonical purine NTP pyrophosphatase, partial [Deltaproteobacteria bacterium]|nr:Non-canonical purine NTP pyrophosphatase [Deltaproteobacteria bacterium]